ncbi:hypothetical protein GM921_07505 [Pedobacter sp. LMG 31464]|uniref:MG2 domain-containing protein n=1 Tax=Pedobacter planticolens TaxID=2679964 RepID=A0A923DZJ1_9SPHI|nr:Plug and carboxypeptidase regulatory-like domain-containing protein [Pedobacter planticolens]MBB2145323.1 hypothetical protein [Pedobacter planticolens]
MMPKLQTLLLSLLFVFSLSQSTFAQTADSKSGVISEYDRIREIAPREKLYVHFDKSVYTPQDTIWFKGYLVNASFHAYSQISGLIYTEMINWNGEVVQTLSLPTVLGLTWGAFPLKEDKYPPGNYTFRAYTNWMQNFGDTYLFKKEIKILAIDANQKPAVTKSKVIAEKTSSSNDAKRNKQEVDIQFLPEGGSWVADFPQKMAFKALDKSAKGIEVSGEILDSKQNKVTEFKSNFLGMGYFTLSPLLNETYTAKVKLGNELIYKNLPKAIAAGTVISLRDNNASDSLSIALSSTLVDQKLILLGQSKGLLCFVANINANTKGKTIKVSKDIFPTGVSQILLMNDKKEVLNERNFFLNHNDQLKVSISSKSLEYTLRDSIPIHIKVSDYLGKPVSGSFSMAVTDDNQVSKDSLNDENILSYLLMTSDLKGQIEKPGYYFHQQNEQTKSDLDALMLTQGWVSYNWDVNKKLTFNADKEYTISGKITNVMSKPSANAKVILLGKNKGGMILDTLTNQNGEFVFDQLPPIDSASFVIQAKNAKGKAGTLGITVNEFVRPPIITAKKKNNVENNEVFDSVGVAQIIAKNQVYEAALKGGILLREVKITGKKTIKDSKNLNGAGKASQILTEEDLTPIYKKTLLEVLQEKIKGFREGNRKGNGIRDFFVNGDQVKFIFDGIDLDFFYQPPSFPSNNDYYLYVKSYIDYYNAEDIRGIEILSNGYSFRYRNEYMSPMDPKMYAFIEVTTKTGTGPFLKKAANMYLLKPINYGSDRVFYSPKYTSVNRNDKFLDYRSTIYWNPTILTNTNGEADVSFFSADKKGNYTVWIEGTDTEGGLGVSVLKLSIK